MPLWVALFLGPSYVFETVKNVFPKVEFIHNALAPQNSFAKRLNTASHGESDLRQELPPII